METWKRAPDKIITFQGIPVMLWIQPKDMRARFGTIEIDVYRSGDRYRAPVGGLTSMENFFGYSGEEWDQEPSAEEFEEYVLRVFKILRRDGRI